MSKKLKQKIKSNGFHLFFYCILNIEDNNVLNLVPNQSSVKLVEPTSSKAYSY